MEATCSSEMLVDYQGTTRYYNLEDRTLIMYFNFEWEYPFKKPLDGGANCVQTDGEAGRFRSVPDELGHQVGLLARGPAAHCGILLIRMSEGGVQTGSTRCVVHF
jgi:hypothetical protein